MFSLAYPSQVAAVLPIGRRHRARTRGMGTFTSPEEWLSCHRNVGYAR